MSSWCLFTVGVLWPVISVLCVDLQRVIVVFPSHSRLLFIIVYVCCVLIIQGSVNLKEIIRNQIKDLKQMN